MTRYYIDTCIWLDFRQNRTGYAGEPLGEYAARFFQNAIRKKQEILYSVKVIDELKGNMNQDEIRQLFQKLASIGILRMVPITEKCLVEATALAKNQHIPFGDSLHAILAKSAHSILITRDNHFKKFKNVLVVKKPEELI